MQRNKTQCNGFCCFCAETVKQHQLSCVANKIAFDEILTVIVITKGNKCEQQINIYINVWNVFSLQFAQ